MGSRAGEYGDPGGCSGPRAEGPFVVVDVGALPANLIESELFGHERGAFTGAVGARAGAFEAADGGTIFLDEIGELPQDLQPKLLRVLERKAIRRVGATRYREVDVRIVAATHRDLARAVNQGWFRADLFYRLAVVPIEVPALRERLDDLEMLVDVMLRRLDAAPETVARLARPGFISELRQSSWPGNVRELRNHLERCMVFDEALDVPRRPAASQPDVVDASMTYGTARRRALDVFEARFLEALLEAHDSNVSQAARAAEINRPYLYQLLRKHGLR